MFISRLRASGADDRSPWGDFWFSPVGGRTGAGARVTSDSAMRLSTVYSCVRVHAESMAVLPFKLYRPRIGGRGRTLVTDHWAYRLFAKRPNRFQNRFEWTEMLQGHLSLRGNAFCEIIDGPAGAVMELLPLHPDRVTVEGLPGGEWRYVHTLADGTQRRLRRDQVFKISGLSSDGILGLNPIELQRETIGAGLAAQDYGNRFWVNDAKPTGGWIEMPQGTKFADEAAKERFKSSLQSATSGANRHKTLVLEGGMKYNEIGLTNKDSQFLEARGFTRSEICGFMRVPPHMVGDLSRATFSNIEQQAIDFWQNCMLPWSERWEAAIEALIGEDTDLEVEYDFRNLMRGDGASRAAYIHQLVLDGVLTRNEGRQIEGYDPIEGLDEPLVPVNERELSDPDPNGEQGQGEVLPDAVPGDADEDGAAATTRLAALLQGNARRMARRCLAGQPPAATVLADALAITQQQAAAWLSQSPAGTEDELTAQLAQLGATP